jgi:integrase/recombinase XerD
VEHISRFVSHLRAPADNVMVLEGGTARRAAGTVNRHLAALLSFYDCQARNGLLLAKQLMAFRRTNRGGYRPFLHHVTGGRPGPTRPLRMREPRRLPRTLTADEVVALVESCERLRDRFCSSCSQKPG